jgi:hypothetical protein
LELSLKRIKNLPVGDEMIAQLETIETILQNIEQSIEEELAYAEKSHRQWSKDA